MITKLPSQGRRECRITLRASASIRGPLILVLLGPSHQVFRIERRIKGNLEESEHHFFPALVAVFYFFIGIRIRRVVRRVVVVGRALDNGALRKLNRALREIRKLPTK